MFSEILNKVKDIVIRRAGPEDVGWILGELSRFSQFVGTHRPLFEDAKHAQGLVEQVIAKHLFLVAERNQDKLGFIAGVVLPHPFNPSIRTLSEQWWWVCEEHRRSRAGLLLLDAFVEWGEANVDWISFSVEAKSPVRDETLTRRGFRLQEKTFLREVR
jgi:hypothetical protein